MRPYSLSLPWPPSVNHYWIRQRQGFRVSDEGQAFRFAVSSIHRRGHVIIDPVRVLLEFTQPDRRRRDLDNLAKCVLDALTKASVWMDDSQVHDLRMRWIDVPPAGCRVTIESMAAAHHRNDTPLVPTDTYKKRNRALEKRTRETLP
jgi:crossover junction endodeoxyribonuclease RusA